MRPREYSFAVCDFVEGRGRMKGDEEKDMEETEGKENGKEGNGVKVQ